MMKKFYLREASMHGGGRKTPFCNARAQVLISEKENIIEVELVSSAEQSTLLQLQCVFQCGCKN